MNPTKPQKRIFVIQEHHATNLHYDFRLEISGVLKSWAVPKNLSDKFGEKRLAILVDDHDLEYADFEGEIAEGYGKGKVIIWDKGEYKSIKPESLEQQFDSGRLEIELLGKKLKGNFCLIKTSMAKNSWLVFKMGE